MFCFDYLIDQVDIDITHAASSFYWNWWDYSDGVSGPAAWGYYFRLCGAGRFQSPINIESRHLIFDYQLTPITINNSANVRFLFLTFEDKKIFFFFLPLGTWNPS